METQIRIVERVERCQFQKDLIVWKPVLEELDSASDIRFQKDLIVWKRVLNIAKGTPIIDVSEGLNSVETRAGLWSGAYNLEFQKDLIVWKLKGVRCPIEIRSMFQKDLIV